jgi:DNA-binding response OmpR family regulator
MRMDDLVDPGRYERAARVLLCGVDDTLAELLARNLTRRGFDVQRLAWTPCCGDKRDLPGEVDVVVADLDCPESDARHTLARLRELVPAQPLVVLTDEWLDPERLQAGCLCLRKPVAMSDFLRAVRDCIQVAPGPRSVS